MTFAQRGLSGKLLATAMLLGLAASTAPVQAAGSINSMSFTVKYSLKPSKAQASQMKGNAMGANAMNASSSIMMKGKKSVIQMPAGMGVIMNDGAKSYVYNPARKMAVLQSSAQAAQASGPLGGVTGGGGAISADTIRKEMGKLLAGAKKVGAGSANGHKCSIYEATKLPGGMTMPKGHPAKMWIANDMVVPFLVKVQASNPGGGAMDIDLVNIKLNPSIPDSAFALPPGTKIVKPNSGPGATRPMPRKR
jgi:outer membrane lipoprotein-sorting protein